MFTGTTLAACLIHADVRARATGEAQTVLAAPNLGVVFSVLTSEQVVAQKAVQNLDATPIITVLPDGSVEIHRPITFPPEAIAHVR